MPFRFHPTAARADAIRAELARIGCKARVARQRFAFRVVVADASEMDLASAQLFAAGFGGPCGGAPVRNGHCELFAYDFRGEAA